ncbi:hypothetical protein K435DRAFT_782294 [Dendrothele bispora CBS 962.96]|uniref:Uncharacterized protein n=1 Tax=Dendrothele bispora (strain CBS 962.96) TaxID=1314807 RepID=A0A4S8LFV7_DENBC|nr:hypothetical protein K435DRAFT_782294 [Dendrothele bispora CBS 962.96]
MQTNIPDAPNTLTQTIMLPVVSSFPGPSSSGSSGASSSSRSSGASSTSTSANSSPTDNGGKSVGRPAVSGLVVGCLLVAFGI